MADSGRAMSDLGIGDGLLSGLDAIQKILLVIEATVQMQFIGFGVVGQQRIRLSLHTVSIDRDPALTAFKANVAAIALALTQYQCDIIGIGIDNVRLFGGGKQPPLGEFAFSVNSQRSTVVSANACLLYTSPSPRDRS